MKPLLTGGRWSLIPSTTKKHFHPMPQETFALITAPRTLWNTNTAQEPEPSCFALTTYVRPQPRYSLDVFVDNVLLSVPIKVIKAPFSSESAFRVTSVPRLRATDFLLPWQTVRLQAPVSLQRVPGGRMGHVWESDNSQSLLSFPGTFINFESLNPQKWENNDYIWPSPRFPGCRYLGHIYSVSLWSISILARSLLSSLVWHATPEHPASTPEGIFQEITWYFHW